MQKRRYILAILLIICGIFATESLSAQYYSWGADPASFRWRQMRAKEYRVVYPDTAQEVASRMMYYLDAVKDDIDYGYRYPQMSIPFVVHPSNFRSNGLVMWMPRRVEFLSSPEVNGYSMPWTKQLIAHEYRHAVQYNNLNRGIVKALSYIIGQQSSTIGLLFMPLWMMEGDAVMTETEMSTFGRGLQPSFTMPYRAYGNVATEFRCYDKWFCGSYKDYIPNHYNLGYLMSRHGYNRFGRVMGDDVAELTSRRPYMAVSVSWVLRRLYGTSESKLFYDTFNTLYYHWHPLSEVEPSMTYIPLDEPKSYTTFAYPQPMGSGEVLFLKEDFDEPMAFVAVDARSGSERHIANIGALSSRPALGDVGRVWWTEYRQSALFAEQVYSTLCYMDLDKGKPYAMRKCRNVLYATPTSEYGIAWVEYTADGRYTIVVNGAMDIDRRTPLPYGSEIHGMAWDDATKALYVIITDDDGMHISRVVRGGVERITRSAYTTISDLRAKGGKLYFGSIASGRDEAHALDLATRREYRLTTSRYGSFQPMPINDSVIVATTYDRRGYMPSLQSVDSAKEVRYLPHPPKIMLPKSKPWGVVNLDTVHYDAVAAEVVAAATPSKRFSRMGHAFNIHSWAPASFDPYAIVEESSIAFNLGATIMSQNILSNTEGFLTWGWNPNEGSVYKGTLRYKGLGVNLWVNGTYGGSQQIYKIMAYDVETQKLVYSPDIKRDKYYSIGVGATLPILIPRGYHTQQFVLSSSWNFSNGMVANIDDIEIVDYKVSNIRYVGYSEGVHQLSLGVGFQDMVRQSHRDFLPPWGVVLSANYTLNPTTNDMGHLMVLYGKLYTPGFAKHHSLSLAASYQTSLGGFHSDLVLSALSFKSTRLVPRGYSAREIQNDNYAAASLNYQMPVWYPDGGIEGVIYFKRLRLNIGADYASFDKAKGVTHEGKFYKNRNYIGSVGLDLGVDFTLFAMPDAATISATFSLYKKMRFAPFREERLFFSFGLGLPF